MVIAMGMNDYAKPKNCTPYFELDGSTIPGNGEFGTAEHVETSNDDIEKDSDDENSYIASNFEQAPRC